MTMRRLTLKAEPEPFEQAVVIAASVEGYRLCHFLNRLWGADFSLSERLPYRPKAQPFSPRPAWAHFDEALEAELLLIPNGHAGEWLLPQLRGADYLLAARPEPSTSLIEQWMADLRSFSWVSAAYIIGNDQLQNLSLE